MREQGSEREEGRGLEGVAQAREQGACEGRGIGDRRQGEKGLTATDSVNKRRIDF